MNKALETLRLQLKEANDNIDKIWEDDFDNGVSWEQHVENSKNAFAEYFKIYEEYSTIGKPEDYAFDDMDEWVEECKMSIDDFVGGCKCGLFTNDDGTGFYATKDKVSCVCAYPNLFVKGKVNKNFDFVVWYNK